MFFSDPWLWFSAPVRPLQFRDGYTTAVWCVVFSNTNGILSCSNTPWLVASKASWTLCSPLKSWNPRPLRRLDLRTCIASGTSSVANGKGHRSHRHWRGSCSLLLAILRERGPDWRLSVICAMDNGDAMQTFLNENNWCQTNSTFAIFPRELMD